MSTQSSLRSLRALRQSSSTLSNLSSIQSIQPSSSQLSLLQPHIISRGKRSKASKSAVAQAATVQRLVTQLSVFSARKKQPRQIKLCLEDYLRHNVATRAWALYQQQIRDQHKAQLEAQYAKIVDACNDLETISPYLSTEATKRERGKRFSVEMRVPTDTPPNVIWQADWKRAESNEAKKEEEQQQQK